MDPEARIRLKNAMSRSGWTAKGLSEALGFAPTYLSRLCTGGIKEPSLSRLQAICEALNVEVSSILTDGAKPNSRDNLLSDLATAPDHVIAEVADFVRSHGLVRR